MIVLRMPVLLGSTEPVKALMQLYDVQTINLKTYFVVLSAKLYAVTFVCVGGKAAQGM
jgi:hypothetical protein